jgi:hypothetical protein
MMKEETQANMDDEIEQPLWNDELFRIAQRTQLKQYLENHRPQIWRHG